jgi:hypothetical protein
MKQKIYLCYIEFLDHASQSNWQNNDELKNMKPTLVHQSGWLVEEDKYNYKVAGQVTEDGDVGDCITIVKSTVKKIKLFKNVKL